MGGTLGCWYDPLGVISNRLFLFLIRKEEKKDFILTLFDFHHVDPLHDFSTNLEQYFKAQ